MDKFPLLRDGRSVGELTTEREALYTWFEARCGLPGDGLWCAWAVGDRGELRLGVLEPEGEHASIRRRFSAQLTGPLGRLQWGEVRPAHPAAPGDWLPAGQAADLFRSPWLRERLWDAAGALTRTENGRRYVALPYDPERPFPLPSLFCLARICRIGGRNYAVYAFDQTEQPVL